MVDEAVITDDGSKVDIAAGVRHALPGLPFPVRLVTQPDKGFRAAKCRNNGIRAATGDYLIFADQDVVFPRDYVKTFLDNLRPREFLVGYPVRLTEEQSAAFSDEDIREGRFHHRITEEQLRVVRKQFRKDAFYRMLHALKLRPIGPKLRSGVFGAWRSDLLAVNGFDEAYQGWGNEDDDLGLRLHRYGVRGRNVFDAVYPLHLYHPPHHAAGVRTNKEYYDRRMAEIRQGEYRARDGVESPLGGDESVVTELWRGE
jgi:GT2 family glycosyltransferase